MGFPDGKLTKNDYEKLVVLYKKSRKEKRKIICENWDTNKLYAKDRSQTLKYKEIHFFMQANSDVFLTSTSEMEKVLRIKQKMEED